MGSNHALGVGENDSDGSELAAMVLGEVRCLGCEVARGGNCSRGWQRAGVYV